MASKGNPGTAATVLRGRDHSWTEHHLDSIPSRNPQTLRFKHLTDGRRVVVLPPVRPEGPRASVAVRHLTRLRRLLPDALAQARVLNLIPDDPR
jgi:hypothetical protein